MPDYYDALLSELECISKQIYTLKERITITHSPSETKKLQRGLKRLQYQALFYAEKIERY